MLEGLIAPRLRLGLASATPHLRFDYALASISCEHCRSSRNNPHYAPRHIIARSHTVLSQANMVVVARYALSFWQNGHEERVQCELVHYRDAKATSCLPKISFKAMLTDSLEMPIVSRSLIVNRRILSTKSLISMTCSSLLNVFSRPGLSLPSTYSLSSLNILCHWNVLVFDRA